MDIPDEHLRTILGALRYSLAGQKHFVPQGGWDAITQHINAIATIQGEIDRRQIAVMPKSEPPIEHTPHRCTCVHAPEQHGVNGCGTLKFSGPCPCMWNGRTPDTEILNRRGLR